MAVAALAVQETAGGSATLMIAQVTLLVLLGRVLGEAMQRIGQPSTIGQLMAGIALGPSVLGVVCPSVQHALFPSGAEQRGMIEAMAQFGILMLLLLAGMETELGLVKKMRRQALSVSIAGIAAPFAGGFAVGQLLPDAMLPNPEKRLAVAIFLGTALSISSVKIVAVVVRELNFLRRNVGQVMLASAMIDDTLGWIIIAIAFSIASSGSLDLAPIVANVGGIALFLVFAFTIGRRLVYFLIRWVNDHCVGDLQVASAALVLMGAMALTTHLLGVQTVLGAFVAGVLIGDSPILTRDLDDQIRGLTTALFTPVFFGLAGLNSDLTILANPTLLLSTLALIAIATLGKFAGAYIGGWAGGLSRPESLAMACGMNARGATEVIVASVGLSAGVLNRDLYTMIVAMAIMTTVAMPPSLRWALRRLPVRGEEQARLEHEEFVARAFVPGLKRLLVVADASATGVLAARIAGLLATPQATPTTILQLGERASEETAHEPADGAEKAATDAQRDVRAQAANGGEEPPQGPAKIAVPSGTSLREVIANEASKGFDLLVIGVDPVVGADGRFEHDLARGVLAFPGPVAIVSARGVHRDDPKNAELDILASTTGAEVNQRAAELALALGRAPLGRVTALYVPETPSRRPRSRISTPDPDGQAVLDEVRIMAKHYGAEVVAKARADATVLEATFQEMRRHNLLVMGVSRRPGKDLSFGSVAKAILESSAESVMLVAS